MEDVAAIVLFGKLTRNGWLPRSGTVTRIVEVLGTCGAAAIAEVSLCGAGILGVLGVERTAFGRRPTLELGRTSLELAGGGMFRTTGLNAPLGSGLTSGFGVILDSVAADESASVERASAESEIWGFSLGLSSEAGGFSEGVELSTPFLPAAVSELAAWGSRACGVDSSAASGCAGSESVGVGGLASAASKDLGASRRRFPRGPRPTVSPTVNDVTANNSSNANALT